MDYLIKNLANNIRTKSNKFDTNNKLLSSNQLKIKTNDRIYEDSILRGVLIRNGEIISYTFNPDDSANFLSENLVQLYIINDNGDNYVLIYFDLTQFNPEDTRGLFSSGAGYSNNLSLYNENIPKGKYTIIAYTVNSGKNYKTNMSLSL